MKRVLSLVLGCLLVLQLFNIAAVSGESIFNQGPLEQVNSIKPNDAVIVNDTIPDTIQQAKVITYP